MHQAETRGAAELVEADPVRNLTQWEYLALNGDVNVADGHARQPLTPSQAKIVDDLPLLFEECERRPVEEIEFRAHHAYLTMTGQHGFPQAPGRVLSCYSSSVAMEIFSRALATSARAVALVHPTFDNIADLLRGNGLRLIPLAEGPLAEEDLPAALLREVGCVFVTTPNNPTGRVVTEERLRRLAEQCATHDVVLTLDTSFRGFDPRAQYDHYPVLEESGCRWAVIEDTGKLWPTLDLKVGMLVTASHLELPVLKIYSDILLGVSPLILAMVARFAEDAAMGGLEDLHRFVAANRALVREGLAGLPGVSFPDPGSRVSVERVDLGAPAKAVWTELTRHNVYALPCDAFHWADPSLGERSLRLALARSGPKLSRAVGELRAILDR